MLEYETNGRDGLVGMDLDMKRLESTGLLFHENN